MEGEFEAIRKPNAIESVASLSQEKEEELIGEVKRLLGQLEASVEVGSVRGGSRAELERIIEKLSGVLSSVMFNLGALKTLEQVVIDAKTAILDKITNNPEDHTVRELQKILNQIRKPTEEMTHRPKKPAGPGSVV